MFATYIHNREDDGKVFYVGKGDVKRVHSFKNRNKHWHHVVSKHGRTVTMCAQWPTEAEAFDHEKFLILCFKDMKMPLVNLTDGGEGPSGFKHSAETKAKVSAIVKAAMTPERRAAISAQVKATTTTEHIQRMSEAALAARTPEREAHRLERLRSPETSAKMSASAKASMTPERRAHLSAISIAAGTGRVCSAETKAKIAAAHKGLKHSEETKRKLSCIVKAQMTPERRALMSASTAAQMTPEHRLRLSMAHRKSKKESV